MTPQRLPHLSSDQAREVAAQIDALRDELHKSVYSLWIRMMVITTILLIGVAITSAIALDVYSTAASKHDLNAAQSNSLKDARNLALKDCLLIQGSRLALRVLVNVTIPRHDHTRSAVEADRIAGLYAKLDRKHVLDVPTCRL